VSRTAPAATPNARSDLGVIDSHCHLQTLDLDACRRALDDARESGVVGFLVPAIRLEDADRLLELSSREADVWCALGVHPHEARTWTEGHDQKLRDLLDEPFVVAVGECGLDFHYDLSPREIQIEVMRRQWEIATEAGLPVVVHNRKSNQSMSEVLAEERFAALEGVFHSFAGGASLAKDLVGRGFFLGLSGMITFPRADNVREVLRTTPSSRLLVETDTPYLAPVPHRGRPNRPKYVIEVLERLADELDRSPDELATETNRNFRALFRKVETAR